MVRTWDDSWFSEPGVRVLYTLPRAWTDRILPLTLEPKPRELARVMVGRAELITPPMEWELLKQVVRFADGDERADQGGNSGVGVGRTGKGEPGGSGRPTGPEVSRGGDGAPAHSRKRVCSAVLQSS